MKNMGLKWKDLISNTAGQVMLALLLFIIGLCSSFLVYVYHQGVKTSKQTELAKLQAISKSLAAAIDGKDHQTLFEEFRTKDVINRRGQSSYYDRLNELLSHTARQNALKSDVYTLVFDSVQGNLDFGVNSSAKPYYRHKWEGFSESHLKLYSSGAGIGPYQDDNGMWLSSFSPIKNHDGKTVALIQVDEPFDKFISAVRAKVGWQIAIMLCFLIPLALAMLYLIQSMLKKEQKTKWLLQKQGLDIEQANRELLSSITRAKTIQEALKPDLAKMKEVFPDMFVMFQPRDIVSGDFYWYAKENRHVYFAVADCTGHGVPGAFMSMIGQSILNEVLHNKTGSSPAELLTALDKKLTGMLQENSHSSSADGMDIALVRYNLKTHEVEFSGAMRPLYHVSGSELRKVSGDKFSIGGTQYKKKTFKDHRLKIDSGDCIYLFSDGYADQFGGKKNKKYMSKKFAKLLQFAQEHVMEDQQYLLQYEFHHWRNEIEQIDDVLVAGIKIPDAA